MPPSIPDGVLPYSVNGNKTVQDKKNVRQDFAQQMSRTKQVAEELY